MFKNKRDFNISKELTSNGYIVGSDEYFRNINDSTFLGAFMTSNFDYKQALLVISNNISDVLDQIYKDLTYYSSILRYIDLENIEDTASFVSNIGNIQQKYGSFNNKILDCLYILNSAKTMRNFNEFEINSVINYFENNNYFNAYESYLLLKKVLDNGVFSAVNNQEEEDFLSNLTVNYDEELLNNILEKYNFQNNSTSYICSNGKQICSKEYINDLEKNIFGNGLLTNYVFSSDYTMYMLLISNSFQKIVIQIEDDLSNGESLNDYIMSGSAENLRNCLKNLEEMDVRCYNLYSLVDKLDWFAGGDYNKVLALQKELNNLGYNLLEDGVYGEKTSNAVKSFAELSANVSPYIHELATGLRVHSDSTIILSAKVGNRYLNPSINFGTIGTKISTFLAIYEAYEVIQDDIDDDIPGFSKETAKEVISGLGGDGLGIYAGIKVGGAVSAVATPWVGIPVGIATTFVTDEVTTSAIEGIFDIIDKIEAYLGN